ncbi:type VII secretion-associated serine protease mycosin [Streptomyces sp. TRM68416]|uniref:type VII secretion-associated serine protease mycosin n=1 Tax=Streptomyces sp. TRM68416 TaxID=2758412 RepID=UPI001661AFBA|nr:type VII secretion-associated serine protease mycosin [Streptomyces sp. TRM68416]MBD0840178.1 type VII secretion-associated serine protease mycosin [Streptomyces sp. TRM68416]
MLTRSERRLRPLPVVAAALGVLLVGVAATPAHAESVRARQWHLDAMQADEMWETSTGSGITVAVIDSGVDDSLADLKGQVIDGKDYSSQSGDEHTDLEGHGTGIAALIAATGARGSLDGSYGLAPGAKILPVRMRYATEDFGQVDSKAEYSRVLTQAIRYAADSPARIINISMGSSNAPGRQNVGTPELASAVRYALDKGKLIFAAVGNSGNKANLIEYPAATPGVVGVGAADQDAKALPMSQTGPQVDLAAPGTDMIHACTDEGTQVCRSNGTSDATAIASASAALIWAKHPDWTNNQVLRVMLNTAGKPKNGDERTDYIGYGVVRPRVALSNPGDPGPADEYPLPDLAAAAPPSPSPGASEHNSSPSPGEARREEKHGSASAAASEDDNTALWIAAGIGAAALLSAAIAVPWVRGRRRSAQAPPAAPQPPTYSPYSPQQQYPPLGPPQGHVTGTPPEGAPGPGHHR